MLEVEAGQLPALPDLGGQVLCGSRMRTSSLTALASLPDPDPPDPPSGSGSGSISQRYGSGSGDFSSLKKDANVPSKVISRIFFSN